MTAHLPFPFRRRRAGFTLVELLVVIGIVALLISILLPSLARAREQANQTKCLSNMRSIALALVMYCDSGKGALPRPAEGPPQKPHDFVYWQPKGSAAPYDDVNQSALTPYIGTNGRFPVEIEVHSIGDNGGWSVVMSPAMPPSIKA